MKEYKTVPFFSGCFSGSLDEKKLNLVLNDYAKQGWRLSRTIHESKLTMFGNRETHFLIFERDIDKN